MTLLKALYLHDSGVKTLKMQNLSNLETLILSTTRYLEEISLENMPHLKNLDLAFSDVKTLKGLNTLSSLEELDLSYTSKLEEVSLENLTQLKNLNLSGYTFKTIKGLNTLSKLETLELENASYLQSLEFTEDMKDLKIKLTNSGIKNKAQIKGFEHLDENKITW